MGGTSVRTEKNEDMSVYRLSGLAWNELQLHEPEGLGPSDQQFA